MLSVGVRHGARATLHVLWLVLEWEHVLATPSDEAETPDLECFLEDLDGEEA